MFPSIFAEAIGLDKNPGDWSRPRIVLFVIGLFFVVLAGIYHQFNQQLSALTSRVLASYQNQPFVIWLNEDKAIQRALRFVNKYIFTITIPVAILIIYAWLASSGTWTVWKSPTFYYSGLAEAFLNGNLHLSIQPDQKLLVLKDPYDSSNRAGIEIPVDISLYNGKFYMYWGPAPALLLSIVQAFTRKEIGDLSLAFTFVSGICLAQSALLFAIWKQYYSKMPKWFVHLSILLAGLTGPIILLRHNYDNARIYEASIAGTQFFLMIGLWVAITALIESNTPNLRLFITGVFWSLAIGTRQTSAAPIGFMVLLICYQLIKTRTSLINKIVSIISLGTPLLVGVICLGWYNWARFGSVTETGLYYTLTEPYLQGNYTELFSTSYSLQNLYNYILNPPEFISKFPFVFMVKGSQTSILPFYKVPEFYNAQPITGLIFIFPFALFAITFLLQPLLHQIKDKHLKIISDDLDHKLPDWIALNIGIACLIAFILLTGFFWAGMRYAGDFLPLLTTLSILGFWQGYLQFPADKTTTKKIYIFLGISLAVLSILISILLAISINSNLVNIVSRSIPFTR